MSYALGVLGRLARKLAVAAAMGLAVYLASRFGPSAAGVAATLCLIVLGSVTFWLPRAAHGAFVRGDARRAAWYYRMLRLVLLDLGARASVEVSIAACDLQREQFSAALEGLAQVERDQLSDAGRCVWLNNRAYALARDGTDPTQALADADEAVARRPEVAGFRHTRGVALLALGRIDDAIRELDAVWHALPPDQAAAPLEAERCFDLGTAWARKGEREYARDYFERAQRAAPASRWAERAAQQLGDRPLMPLWAELA